jgi:hypothetical protein
MKRKFRVTTTDSNHNYSISPNRLQRDFRTNVANEVYNKESDSLKNYVLPLNIMGNQHPFYKRVKATKKRE